MAANWIGCLALMHCSLIALCGVARCEEGDSTDLHAAKLVERALQAELEGDETERHRLLQLAVRQADDFGPANWQLGRVASEDGFVGISESIAGHVGVENLEEYRQLRDAALGDPKAEKVLAWQCARLGLSDEARLFYYRVVTNPDAEEKSRRAAMKTLGLQPAFGTYMTAEQIRERREAENEQRATFDKWLPKVKAWHNAASSERRGPTMKAMKQIADIDDKPFIFVTDGLVGQVHRRVEAAFVEFLQQHPEFEATRAITRYAIASPAYEVRRAAIAELKNRRPHDYVPLLLEALVAPIESHWRVEMDQNGNLRYRHQFSQEGQQATELVDLEHTEQRVESRDANVIPNARVPGDNLFLQGRTELNSPDFRRRELAPIARAREEEVARFNDAIAEQNKRAQAALVATTGQPEQTVGKWQDWWLRYNETYAPRPVNRISKNTQSRYVHHIVETYEQRHACFPPGTPVWTGQGLRPIETITVGDRVLSQDVNTGELSWELVVQTTAGASTSTHVAHFQVDGESIFPPLGHVVWATGGGWKIAKRVADGDRVRTLSGSATLTRLEDQRAPDVVHNVVIPDTHTYFVGRAGLLVHDITTRQPTLCVLPGFAAPTSGKQPR